MSNLQQLTTSQSNKETRINEVHETLEWGAVYGKNHPTTAGLTWGYCGGRWSGFSISAGTFSLTNNTVNYLVVSLSTGVMSASASATNWNDTSNYARVYKITTVSGVVTAVEDHRVGSNGVMTAASAVAAGAHSEYDFTSSSTTTNSDPGTGVLRWNNATQASATALYVDNAEASGTSLASLWATVTAGAHLKITHGTDSNTWQQWAVTSITSNVGYYTFGVSLLAQEGSNIPTATAILLELDLTGSGAAGTVTSVTASNGLEVTAGGAITATGALRGAVGVNPQTGSSYTVLTSDRGQLVTRTNAADMTDTLPQAGASFPAGWYTTIKNKSATKKVTVTPTTSTINGQTAIVLQPGQSATIVSDGTNYDVSSSKDRQYGELVLTDGATITPDCTDYLNMRVVMAGNRLIGVPTNAQSGDVINIRFVQDATGSRVPTLHAKYKFNNLGSITFSTSAGAVDLLTGQYSAVDDDWRCGFIRGS